MDFAIVEDVAKEGAFDTAVVSDPPFEAVIHTASPFHFNVTDVQKELLDPAVIGTTGILKSIKKSAPTVKKVAITSSFAAIIDGSKGERPGYTYTEKDWSPLTHEQALENPSNGYRASKTFAEKAAWDFVAKEKPNFTLTTLNPPLVIGPIVHHLQSLDKLNTSNQRVRDMLQGKARDEIPPTGVWTWIDVRDIALCHVKAIEIDAAAGKRFLVSAGNFSNKEIADILRKNFPEYKDKLPTESTKGGDYPEKGVFKTDNSQTLEVFGIKLRGFEECIVDTAKSLQAAGA